MVWSGKGGSCPVSGVIILVLIKHLGLLGSLFALFRRQSRR
jgi:hypothetical protein